MRGFFATIVWIVAALGSVCADDLSLLSVCLTGSTNPEEVAKSKRACTSYLADLMQDIRFGTTTRQPFCLPSRELTAEESNLIFKRFSSEHAELPEMNRLMISGVITVKAYRCPSN